MGKLEKKNILFDLFHVFRSCILESNLCNWSYGTCAHANISQKNEDLGVCLKKKSTVKASDCKCDQGFEPQKVNKSLMNVNIIIYCFALEYD